MAVTILCALVSVTTLGARQTGEYTIKAVYLLNVISLTEWPAHAFNRPDEPIRACVIGRDPFGAAIDETMRGERVAGRPIVVERVRRASDSEHCHVAFFPSGAAADADVVLRGLSTRPILTVGESDIFWRGGGMVRLAVEDRKVRVDANSDAARTAGLTLGSRLMQVARQTIPPR